MIKVEDFFYFSFFSDYVQRADIIGGSDVVRIWGRFWSKVVWGMDG